MNATKESGAQAMNEQTEIITFEFSENKQPIRNVLKNGKPWFVAKDVCDVLGLSNSRKATSTLDDDEKADVTFSYTSSNGTTQKRKVTAISESGLYALILRSNKPYARTFRKWITSEVIPTLLKKGIYAMNNNRYNDDFLDLRDVPTSFTPLNNFSVTTITNEEVNWFNINDIHRAIHSTTSANQVAKKLNAKRTLAIKIYTYGNTHPAWFTNETGLHLILSGSKILKSSNQLKLSL